MTKLNMMPLLNIKINTKGDYKMDVTKIHNYKIPYELAKEKILHYAVECGYTNSGQLLAKLMGKGGIVLTKFIIFHKPIFLNIRFLSMRDNDLEVEYTFHTKGLQLLDLGGRVTKKAENDIEFIHKHVKFAEEKTEKSTDTHSKHSDNSNAKKFCSQCGGRNDNKAKFCSGCGEKIT